MDTDSSQPPARIDAAFRNGSLTAVGIILGFSLGFTVQWATDPDPWTWLDVLASVFLMAGLTLQIKSLAELLEVDSLEVPVYRRAKNRFLKGLMITGGGVLITIAANLLDEGFRLFS
jgi:hypothetical protein